MAGLALGFIRWKGRRDAHLRRAVPIKPCFRQHYVALAANLGRFMRDWKL